ncbi:MAG: hypothetical protein GX621_05595 [Pirellulaceae bacterium]|nr:hypothetical protein [Pirellulaceae bacterium]
MFELATCPACGRFAVAPAEWSADSVVRCPHCLAEYVLGQAATQPLPRLIASAIVAAPSADQEAANVPGEATDETRSNDSPAASEAVEELPAEARPTAGDSPVPESDPRPAGHQPGADPYSAPFPSVHGHADAYDFIPEERRRQLDTAAAVAARLRGGARPKNLFAEIVKVGLGGVVGLAIGYWVLNYFGGRRFDWLTVYLPGCPHTRDHWPTGYLRDKSTEEAAPPQPVRQIDWPEPVVPHESSDPTVPSASPEPQVPAEPSAPDAPSESPDSALDDDPLSPDAKLATLLGLD